MIECCSATAAIFVFGGIYLLFPMISTVKPSSITLIFY